MIDFIPLSGSADESRYVEVTAISPERIESVKSICQAAGITPTRIVLQPHASASLVRRCASPTESIYLVCDDLGDDVELAVVADSKIVLSRNVRLGPWIHVESQVQHYAAVPPGAPLEIEGRIVDLFSRGGHEFVDLDVAVFLAPDRPALQARHRAIYKLRAPA